jgi:hypothetical protein
MSCDWNIHCKTCHDTLEFGDANHATDLMRVLIKHAPAIAALAPLIDDPGTFYELELNAGRWRIDISWFAAHARHELVPIDEYGRFATD